MVAPGQERVHMPAAIKRRAGVAGICRAGLVSVLMEKIKEADGLRAIAGGK